jgi:hypothetical protein
MGKCMKNIIYIIALSLVSPFVFAGSTICTIVDPVINIKVIAWDKSTLEAKVIDFFKKIHKGKVTLIGEHNSGYKTNIFFKGTQLNSSDATEFIIFPYDKDKFRMIGVNYELKGNKYYLKSSAGNHRAICIDT